MSSTVYGQETIAIASTDGAVAILHGRGSAIVGGGAAVVKRVRLMTAQVLPTVMLEVPDERL